MRIVPEEGGGGHLVTRRPQEWSWGACPGFLLSRKGIPTQRTASGEDSRSPVPPHAPLPLARTGVVVRGAEVEAAEEGSGIGALVALIAKREQLFPRATIQFTSTILLNQSSPSVSRKGSLAKAGQNESAEKGFPRRWKSEDRR